MRATQAGIVVITEIKPISVDVHACRSRTFRTLSRASAAGVLTAEAFTTDGHSMLDTGTLQVIDNQVDPDHRHRPPQGRLPQREAAALARPVRQRARCSSTR